MLVEIELQLFASEQEKALLIQLNEAIVNYQKLIGEKQDEAQQLKILEKEKTELENNIEKIRKNTAEIIDRPKTTAESEEKNRRDLLQKQAEIAKLKHSLEAVTDKLHAIAKLKAEITACKKQLTEHLGKPNMNGLEHEKAKKLMFYAITHRLHVDILGILAEHYDIYQTNNSNEICEYQPTYRQLLFLARKHKDKDKDKDKDKENITKFMGDIMRDSIKYAARNKNKKELFAGDLIIDILEVTIDCVKKSREEIEPNEKKEQYSKYTHTIKLYEALIDDIRDFEAKRGQGKFDTGLYQCIKYRILRNPHVFRTMPYTVDNNYLAHLPAQNNICNMTALKNDIYCVPNETPHNANINFCLQCAMQEDEETFPKGTTVWHPNYVRIIEREGITVRRLSEKTSTQKQSTKNNYHDDMEPNDPRLSDEIENQRGNPVHTNISTWGFFKPANDLIKTLRQHVNSIFGMKEDNHDDDIELNTFEGP